MSLENKLKDDVKKYCSVFMKNEDNPVLRRIVELDSDFREELCSFYDVKHGEYGFTLNNEDAGKKADFPQDLVTILNEFADEDLKKYDCGHEPVRTDYEKQSQEWLNYSVGSSAPILVSALILGPAFIAATAKQYWLVAAYAGVAIFSIINGIRLKQPAMSLLDKLWDSAEKADSYLSYYKDYSLLKELEPRQK